MRFRFAGLLVLVAVAVMVVFFVRVGLDLHRRGLDLGGIAYVIGTPIVLGSICAAMVIVWRRWYSA